MGYLVRDQLERPLAVLRMFKSHCVPFAEGKPVDPETGLDLVSLQGTPDRAWADRSLTLEMSDLSCSISDVLDPMNRVEQAALALMVPALVTQNFPQLRWDDNHGATNWDRFDLWVEHPVGDPRRWGVMLVRFMPEDETLLRVSRGRN